MLLYTFIAIVFSTIGYLISYVVNTKISENKIQEIHDSYKKPILTKIVAVDKLDAEFINLQNNGYIIDKSEPFDKIVKKIEGTIFQYQWNYEKIYYHK